MWIDAARYDEFAGRINCLVDGTGNPLVLTNVQLHDAGAYSVVVSNGFGSVTSSTAILDVVPVLITGQPQSQSRLRWSTATFAVTASGPDPKTYQWEFNGTNLPGATDNPLLLRNLQLRQAGTYSVAVSNELV